MPNNNNAGMHFIRFASSDTALHEFDFDNQYANRNKNKEEKQKLQTSMWTIDGEPVNVRANLVRKRNENELNLKRLKKEKNQHSKPSLQEQKVNDDPLIVVHSRKEVPARKKENHNSNTHLSENALGNDPRFKEIFSFFK